MTDLSSSIIQSMCAAFQVEPSNKIINRYQCMKMQYVYEAPLKVLLLPNDRYVYVDKVWHNETQGNGQGTKAFERFLANDHSVLVWRAINERLTKWYLRFNGVRRVMDWQGYTYLIRRGSNKFAWTYEDVDMFNRVSFLKH